MYGIVVHDSSQNLKRDDAGNGEKQKTAQAYTEEYFEILDNWEGLYIGEWNSHCIVHSNPDGVGIIISEGETLKQLQDELAGGIGVYRRRHFY